MGWTIIRHWGGMGPGETQRIHVLPEGIAKSDFARVAGEKEKSSPSRLGASWLSPSRSLGIARSGPGTISQAMVLSCQA